MKNLKNVLLYIAIPIILIITVISVSYLTKDTNQMKYSEIIEMVKENEISQFELNLYNFVHHRTH